MTPERLAEIRRNPFEEHSWGHEIYHNATKDLLTYIEDLQTMAASDQETIQKLQMTVAHTALLPGKVKALESENKLLREVAEAADIYAALGKYENYVKMAEALQAYREYKEKPRT